MATLVSSGTASCVLNTPLALTTITAAGTYQLEMDLNGLGVTNVWTWEAATNVLTGGTSRPCDYDMVVGQPNAKDLIMVTEPIALDFMVSGNLIFTLTLLLGSGPVSIPWKIFSV